MEILDNPGKYTLPSVNARAAFFRAVHERLLTDHFGSEIIDELFSVIWRNLQFHDVLPVIIIPNAGRVVFMDAKKFMQLVEEKKKRVLAKKEAPLKWEHKLEAAAKAKADAEAKERKAKAAKHKRRSLSVSDSDSHEVRKIAKSLTRSEESTTISQRDNPLILLMTAVMDMTVSWTRRGKSTAIRNADMEKGRAKHHKHHRRTHSSHSDFSSDDDNDDEIIRKRSRTKHHKHHKRSDSSFSDSSSDEESDKLKHRLRRHKHHRHDTSDSDGYRHGRRSRSIGRSSDDNDELGRIEKRKNYHRHSHHHHHHHHRNGHELRPHYDKTSQLLKLDDKHLENGPEETNLNGHTNPPGQNV
ncbi:hypothetical protein DH2020_011870 [Rehmannia glutinosa]|uniref:Uncharacterized protein n=1 Tax=Rehmannia glutinosa TaxID=99300 RepID=A0ABR0XEQ9_REHGL